MSSQVAFYYGGNLDNTKPFSAGAVYFDTVKKQIWYDDPSGKSTTHTLLTSLGEISEVTSLPSSAKHKDIVLLKTLVSGQTYTYQLNIYDEVKKSWTSLTKNIKDTDVIFTGTTSGSLTKGKNLSENISNLQSQLLTQLSGKEPTISLTSERAIVSNTSGKLAASAVTATELGYLSGVTSKIQSQLNGKAPTNHASTGTTYGTGTASQYGHLKLSDDTDSKSDVTAGYAATPKAVNTVYNLASGIGTQAANSIVSLSYNNTTRVLTATKNNANTATITLPVPSDSVFGLVKSGGDVTITNGIISVKDDSHNHVISNIDGLETELAAKVAKTGDTMTGNLTAPKFIGALEGTATTANYALKMQTYKDGSTTETYGQQYPFYAQWKGSILDLITDGYKTRVDIAKTADVATKAIQDNSGSIITNTYETKVDAQNKLAEAKTYADSKQPLIAVLIPEGSDLNNYVAPGLYGQNAVAIAETLLNNPISGTGILLDVTMVGTLIVQIAYGLGEDSIYKRRCTSQGEWGDWTAIISSHGGTMAGNLIFENNLGFVGKDANGISHSLLRVSASNNLLLGNDSLSGYLAVYNNLTPIAALTKTLNLGATDRQWKSLYISDSISDGTNTATIKEIGYLKGVTSAVQTQLNNKVDKVSGKGLSANDYTSAEKTKLSGIQAGAQVNQNAFSNIVIGSTTIAANSNTDSLTIAAGTGISVSGDVTNKKVIITNSGVRSITTGSSNGTISVNTNGTSTNVAIKGLGSAAYTATTAYDAAGTAQTKADAALASAKTYADNAANAVKNDLLNGAGPAYDTLKELGELIDENTDAIGALETVAANKQPTITGAATTVTSNNLTTNRALISNSSGKIAVSSVTSTELGYLDGVTSAIQTQLNGKADKVQGILYIEGSGTTDTTNKIATWTGTHADIKNYFNGLTIAYKIGTAGSTTTTLNINNLGAVTVVKNVSTGISTSFAVNSIVILTYTTDNTTPYWKIADYDANTRNSVGDYRKNDTKLYFVGTTSSDASTSSSYATSYTNSNIYVNTDNVLYSAKGFQGKLIGNADTATIASKVNITRPSKSILEVAGDMALFSEEIYFFGSDGLLHGAPVNYVIINAKKGANHRTILDCYDLQTGDHYINGCMNAQTGSTVEGANVWTGWVLQPNPASLNKKQDALMGTANRLLKSASDSKIAVSSITITETTSGDTTTITFA